MTLLERLAKDQNEAYRAKQVNNRKNRKRKLKALKQAPPRLGDGALVTS
jgi:hypothetical protein